MEIFAALSHLVYAQGVIILPFRQNPSCALPPFAPSQCGCPSWQVLQGAGRWLSSPALDISPACPSFQGGHQRDGFVFQHARQHHYSSFKVKISFSQNYWSQLKNTMKFSGNENNLILAIRIFHTVFSVSIIPTNIPYIVQCTLFVIISQFSSKE